MEIQIAGGLLLNGGRQYVERCRRRVAGSVLERLTRQLRIVRETFAMLDQERAGLLGFHGDRDVSNRARVGCAELAAGDLAEDGVVIELIAQCLAEDIDEMGILAVGRGEGVEQRLDVLPRGPGAERFGGAAADERVGVGQSPDRGHSGRSGLGGS